MAAIVDLIKKIIRSFMQQIAKAINKLSGGKISPNFITIFGLIGHIPIVYFIAQGQLKIAGILLIIFGLFDTLDGELARLQNKESAYGQLLDSITDRIKEVVLFSGIAFYFVTEQMPDMAIFCTIACGGALLISYINAWGEATLKSSMHKEQKNKLFRGGILPFEVRITVLILGLLLLRIDISIIIIAVLGWVTVLQRLQNVLKSARIHA